jgi:uncharacterized protein involved in type VI secretion and phage assembly
VRAGVPRSDSGDFALCGVYYGVVTQNKDDEKSLARIKVKLPWLDGGDQDQAFWAQLATPMAGDKFGWYCLPDVGDVVAVMFLDGNIDRPVVLGGIWSKTDKTPEDNASGDNDFRGYRSRAGSRVILDDSSNSKVVIADKTNKNVLAIGKFSKGGSGPNASEPPKPAGAGSGGIVAAAMDGKLNITCEKGKLTVSGLQVKMTAAKPIEIKAGADLDIEGTMTEVSSSSPGNYDGSNTTVGP